MNTPHHTTPASARTSRRLGYSSLLIALSLCWCALPAWAQQYSWSTIAGTTGQAGATDTPGSFDRSWMLVRDSSGNLFVPCEGDHTIRKVTPAGVVSTFSGLSGVAGTANGTSGSGGTARFNGPLGIAIDSSNNLYVSDYDSHTIRKITPAGAVTTLAGTVNTSGSTDGAVGVGKLSNPWGLAVDGSGNVYVADYTNNTIRKVTPSGVLSTLAGLAGDSGSIDGTGTSARFSFPVGVALDANGNVVVCGDRTIRRVTPAGEVTTLAGLAGSLDGTDGTGNAARFRNPLGIAVDGTSNTIFVADETAIRRITPGGAVTTVAGLYAVTGNVDGVGSNARFNGASGIIADGTSNTLFVAEQASNTIRKVSYDGVCTTYAGAPGVSGSTAPVGALSNPAGSAHDSNGNLYIACFSSHVIYKVTGGVMTLFAGTVNTSGTTDATGTAARFRNPRGIECDSAGNVYVADQFNDSIRKITPAGVVTTFAGLSGTPGSVDGTGNAARFSFPNDVKVDSAGNVYVSDQNNHTIRKITSGGVVTTLAGLAGNGGSADGTGNAARFSFPVGVAVDAAGNVYVGDHNNHTIRKITSAGVVTTLAGLAGSIGSADGTGSAARFYGPYGLVLDAAGNLIVADLINSTLRKVTPAGVVTTLCGTAGSGGDADGVGSAARLDYPVDPTIDAQGNIYLPSTTRHTVRLITPGGAVRTYIGAAGIAGTQSTPVAIKQGAASFNSPGGVARDSNGNLFVCDATNHTIRKITPAGVVSTFAGLAGVSGSTNDTGSAARFNTPYAIAVDGSDNLYVADRENFTIRKITSGAVVSTLAGSGTDGFLNGTGVTAQFSGVYGIAAQSDGTLYVADNGNHRIRKIVGNVVTTLAGSGIAAEMDGTGAAASFNAPNAICVDSGGFVFVGDFEGKTVRKITPGGVVTTLAGLANINGSADGTGAAARFGNLEGATCDASGQNIYFTDASNGTIRRVTAAGVVTTIGGVAGSSGSTDGVGTVARFNNPAGIILDPSGNMYVGEQGNHLIRKSTRTGARARLVQPENGSALPATTTIFAWEPGVGATNYALFIGSAPGGYDLYAGIEGTNLFKAVTLPADIKVYVTMYSFISGAWQGNHYVFEPAPSQRAVVTSPAQGSTLASATLNLQWAAGHGASLYACWIGSSYGGYDLGAGAYSTSTNTATFTVPTDGAPIYVTLWSYINGAWQRSDHWYITAALNAQRPARLTVPTPNGSTLPSGGVITFVWDAGVGVTSYAIWIGSTPDGYDIYSALTGTNTQAIPQDIPSDGRKLYVTVHSLISGAYQSNSYQFTCANTANPAAFVTAPAAGSALGNDTLALTWSGGIGVSNYALWVGSVPGGYDLYAGSEGLVSGKTVTGLPTDGRVLHVTIWSLINGVYRNNTWWCNAWNNGATARAQLNSHVNGASLPNTATTFTWNAGTGVTSYALWIGSAAGAYDLYAMLEGVNQVRAVTLPSDGRKVYVTLHSLISGAYVSNSYIFTAPQITPVKAVLTSPANGSTLTGSTATFTWQAATGATLHALWIGSQPGGFGNDLYAGSFAPGGATSQLVTGLPTDNRPVYVTLWSFINGAWQNSSCIYNAWQTP